MKRIRACLLALLILLPYLPGIAGETGSLSHAEIKRRLSQYALVPLHADTNALPESERQAIAKLAEAVRAIDDIYWKQRSANGLELKEKLERSRLQADRDLLQFLKINYGPYDKQDNDKPFMGTKPMPEGATFYPEDLTKEEFERYISEHPEVKEDFQKINTVIKRDGQKLVAVPFEQVYRPELERAAKALREASELTADQPFKKYLLLRADALLSGNFRPSDFAWIDVHDGLLD